MAGFTLLPVILAMSLIAAIAFLLNRDNGMNAGMAVSQIDADRARYVAEAGLQAVNAITQGKNCNGYTDLSPTPTAFGADSFTATVTPASGTPVTLTAIGTTVGGTSASLTRANVAVYPITPIPTTATLQAPDSATGTDTSLNVGSVTANYGNLVSIKVQGGAYRGLIKFDLSTIPAGANITGAMLQLSKTNLLASVGTIAVHRVTTPWVEGTKTGSTIPDGATYSTSDLDGIIPWNTVGGGGDYDPAAAASLTNIGAGWSSWDVTGLVQGWHAAPLTNYGMILVPTADVGTVAFDSSDASTVSNHPKLVVTYTAACGVLPPSPPPPPPGTSVTLPAIQDTWINENSAAANYGTGISFKVTNTAKAGRGLVKFDLSSIPAGKTLTSAQLQLYVGVNSFTNPLNSILTVKPVLAPWTETGATWKTANGNPNTWLCGCWGGNLGAAAATASISSTFTSGWVVWDVTALAKDWYANPSLNYGAGVVIDTTSAITFQSRETTASPPYPPQLVITY